MNGMKQRPTEKDEAVLAGAVALLLPRVTEWCVSSGDARANEPAEQQDIAEQLTEAISVGDGDGYSLAKYLDDSYSWAADADLVEILDAAPHRLHEVLCRLTYAWIQETGLEPEHNLGDLVKIQHLSRGMGVAGRKATEYSGTIQKVYRDTGKYTVNVPDLGHAKPGENGTQGLLLTWEEVDGWNRSVAAV